MSNFPLIELPTFEDSRGSLTVLEQALPFKIARSYWIYHADGNTRGGHRHIYSRQALVAINGEVEIFINDGIFKENIILKSPIKCLLLEPKDWHTMTFRNNATLLVMASHPYNRSEYIETPYD